MLNTRFTNIIQYKTLFLVILVTSSFVQFSQMPCYSDVHHTKQLSILSWTSIKLLASIEIFFPLSFSSLNSDSMLHHIIPMANGRIHTPFINECDHRTANENTSKAFSLSLSLSYPQFLQSISFKWFHYVMSISSVKNNNNNNKFLNFKSKRTTCHFLIFIFIFISTFLNFISLKTWKVFQSPVKREKLFLMNINIMMMCIWCVCVMFVKTWNNFDFDLISF